MSEHDDEQERRRAEARANVEAALANAELAVRRMQHFNALFMMAAAVQREAQRVMSSWPLWAFLHLVADDARREFGDDPDVAELLRSAEEAHASLARLDELRRQGESTPAPEEVERTVAKLGRVIGDPSRFTGTAS